MELIGAMRGASDITLVDVLSPESFRGDGTFPAPSICRSSTLRVAAAEVLPDQACADRHLLAAGPT